MNVPVKLGTYLVGLAAAFGTAAAIGAAVGPVGAAAAVHDTEHTASHGDETHATESEESAAGGEHLPGGLLISQNGYTLDVAAELPAGSATATSFRILGPDGRAVTAYDTAHDKDLHLIAVRRDLTGYQHVHPVLATDGTWSIPLDLTAGQWRLFADFDPAGPDAGLVLGADIAVAGDYAPQPLPEQSATTVVDGYTVTLNGKLVAGRESELTLSVSRAGQPVADLQPYLAAYGHLVALRAGDLAYLHVHPAGEPGDGTTPAGPDVMFYATAPSSGDYRLFLDFRHDDTVRTAVFTVHAGDAAASSGTGPSPTVEPGSTEGTDAHTDDGHGH